MRNRLTRIGTPEKAREILSKLLKDGKLTIEDLDQESNHAAYNREIAEKYFPEIKLKPHRNLLRDDVINESVKVSEDRDFTPASRREPLLSRGRSQVLLQKTQEDHSEINYPDLEPESLPF